MDNNQFVEIFETTIKNNNEILGYLKKVCKLNQIKNWIILIMSSSIILLALAIVRMIGD